MPGPDRRNDACVHAQPLTVGFLALKLEPKQVKFDPCLPIQGHLTRSGPTGVKGEQDGRRRWWCCGRKLGRVASVERNPSAYDLVSDTPQAAVVDNRTATGSGSPGVIGFRGEDHVAAGPGVRRQSPDNDQQAGRDQGAGQLAGWGGTRRTSPRVK